MQTLIFPTQQAIEIERGNVLLFKYICNVFSLENEYKECWRPEDGMEHSSLSLCLCRWTSFIFIFFHIPSIIYSISFLVFHIWFFIFCFSLVPFLSASSQFYKRLSGLILVIFLTEPVGLAPHNLTEPERKTLSPVKILYQT